MNLFNHFLFYKKLKLIITELMRLFENIVFLLVKHTVIMRTILCVEFTLVMQYKIHYCNLGK